jgi:hypothetical protein
MTLLTPTVGGEGSETVMVPLATENVSPVYEDESAMVPSEAPEPSKTLNNVPVLLSAALAAPATLMQSAVPKPATTP